MNGDVSAAHGTAHSCSALLCLVLPAAASPADASPACAALPPRLCPSQSSSHLCTHDANNSCRRRLALSAALAVGTPGGLCAQPAAAAAGSAPHTHEVSSLTELCSPGPPHCQQLLLQPLLAPQQSGSDALCAAPQSAAAAGAAVHAGLPGWHAGPARRSGAF